MRAPLHRFAWLDHNNDYGLGEVFMFTSVFSCLVAVAGDGFIIVVLLSFFSAGGLFTVVSLCSQAARSAMPASRQMCFFIQTNRISEERLLPSGVFYCFSLPLVFAHVLHPFLLKKHARPVLEKFARGKWPGACICFHRGRRPIVLPQAK
ncbi:MAG: hypothetical protein DME20_05855 [Verrucomicrobia bacterium]|nr:MAG: hypothetical protein DME74_10270 [Verrucomicrobiota bacterium]PYK49824.1 MAG: hypothetical protein DME20_05855 [Verrucomicrobiota bacterium]PYL44077.1 MAG: hypothetical protein DMF42_02270 [Verrucomicrobiota bacterium]